MNYNLINIANLIIAEYNKSFKRDPLNITKLHKLLYVVYGVYLSVERITLFKEKPLCLPYGPVFESLNNEYKCNNIDFTISSEDTTDVEDHEKIIKIINEVITTFGEHSARTLSIWSHRNDGAWYKAKKATPIWGNPLDKDDIMKEFDTIVYWDK